MYCSNCGDKLNKCSVFCSSCGARIEKTDRGKSEIHKEEASFLRKYTEEEKDEIEEGHKKMNTGRGGNFLKGSKDAFYSEEWLKTNGFAVVALPYYDILINEEGMHVISLPKPYGRALGLIIGLILFKLIGAIVGALIGFAIDRRKHQRARARWISSVSGLTSRKYKEHTFIKIPKVDLLDVIARKGSKSIKLTYGNKKITLKKNKKEQERLFSWLGQKYKV